VLGKAMPRIRYIKNYAAFHEKGEESEDDSQNNQWRSGESWLSNNAVIAAMPESKLKEAIRYYKALVDKLEQELWIRQHNSRISNFKIGSLRPSPAHSQATHKGARKPRQSNRTTGIFKGLKLSQELKSALLECLKRSHTNENQEKKKNKS
jgi:hypothetical protein